MLLTKDEIKKMVDEKLTEKEREYYRKYLKYMIENNFIEVVWFLKHKHLFFTHVH